MKLSLVSTLVLGLLAATAQAGTITWSSEAYENTGSTKEFMGTGQFDTSGTLILADNTGGGAMTFDGISFTAGAINFGNTASAFHYVGPSTTATWNATPATVVTLGSGGVGTLVEGAQYRVQLLLMDGRALANGRYLEVDGNYQGVYANGMTNVTYGDGLLVTGTFTADATLSQSFTLTVYESNGTAGGSQLNALLLYEVPEPSAIVLLGTGLLGLLCYARRKRS